VKKVLRKWTDSEIGDKDKDSEGGGDIEKYFAMKVSSICDKQYSKQGVNYSTSKFSLKN